MRFLVENIMELPLDARTSAYLNVLNYAIIQGSKSTKNIILHIYHSGTYELIHRQLPDYGFRERLSPRHSIIWHVIATEFEVKSVYKLMPGLQ
jgi:hypothetical protein